MSIADLQRQGPRAPKSIHSFSTTTRARGSKEGGAHIWVPAQKVSADIKHRVSAIQNTFDNCSKQRLQSEQNLSAARISSIYFSTFCCVTTYILAAAIGNKGLQLEDRELLERPEQDRNYIHGDAHSPYFPSALALRCRRFRLPRNFEIHMESHSQ